MSIRARVKTLEKQAPARRGRPAPEKLEDFVALIEAGVELDDFDPLDFNLIRHAATISAMVGAQQQPGGERDGEEDRRGDVDERGDGAAR